MGIYFTIRLHFQQVLHFGEMIRSITAAPASDRQGISPFQALCTSLASRVGTGNIAGVAVALVLGGPGAIFWMRVVAFVGMATAYAESTLAQLYKTRDETDASAVYRDGPAFYITKGLGMPWLGAVFSVWLILSFGRVFNAVQTKSIADAMQGAFGLPKIATDLGLAALTAIMNFGGIRHIAQVAEYIVPFYLLVAIIVVIMNITGVPTMLLHIIGNAFGLVEAVGGVAGGVAAAMLNGVKRGLFSNEAAMGSALCSHTESAPPVQLGLRAGLAVAIFFFAFTSIIGNYAFSEIALSFLGVGNKTGLMGCAALC